MMTVAATHVASAKSESTQKVTQAPVTFQGVLATKKTDKIRSFILKDSFDPNKPLENGALPLHYAVHLRAGTSIIQALLDKGAKPFLKDSGGFTATDHALLVRDEPAFTALLNSVCAVDLGSSIKIEGASGQIANQVHNSRDSVKTALGLLQRDKIQTLPEATQEILKLKYAYILLSETDFKKRSEYIRKITAKDHIAENQDEENVIWMFKDINPEEIPAYIEKIFKREFINNCSEEAFAMRDNYGLLPVHHALREYEAHTSLYAKQEYLRVIEKAISHTKDLIQTTASSLSLVHYAILKGCPKAVALLLSNERQREALLQINTLTQLSALHVAFLVKDYESAVLILKYAPQLLTKPDCQGLTPLHILLQHAKEAEGNIGSVSKKELILFAVQCLSIFANAGCSAYCSDSYAKSLSTLLAMAVFSLENWQSQDMVFAIPQGGLEGYMQPAGITRLFFSGRRVWGVAAQSIAGIQKSWHYASYAPLTALKNSAVHLATAGISVGRELLGWWNGAPASVVPAFSQSQNWQNTTTNANPSVFVARSSVGAASY